MAAPFSEFLQKLCAQLRVEEAHGREIAEELRSHLEDKARELEGQGLDRETAQRQAALEMGQPERIARSLYDVHSRGLWRDVALAVVPHLLLAALFALHLWSYYFFVGFVIIGITLVTWRNWRRGNPSKWSYTWLGYTLAAPAISWLLALVALGYGAWTLLTTGRLPFHASFFLLLLGYVPFSLWVTARVAYKVVRRDWLLASFTALPFPFLTSWMLFLNWQGGWWHHGNSPMQESDSERALIFVAMAVTTAAFLRIGPRLVKIGLLTAATILLMVSSAAAIPVSFSGLAVILMALAALAFLFGPAVWEAQITGRPRLPDYREEVVTHWFANASR